MDGTTNGVFRTAVIGVTVRSLSKEVLQSALTDRDIANIRQVRADDDDELIMISYLWSPSRPLIMVIIMIMIMIMICRSRPRHRQHPPRPRVRWRGTID